MAEIVKPEFNEEVVVTLPEVKPISHNIGEIKDFALKLKKYYSTVVFSEDEVKEAAKERAKLNNFKKAIGDIRKKKVDEAKEALGIADFEKTCKEAESTVDEASKMIDTQVKSFEEKDWNDKKDSINKIIDEKAKDLPIQIIWDDKWKNKGYNLDTIAEDIQSQIDAYNRDQETMNKEIDIIKRMSDNPVYIERYKHTRDLTGILDDIDRDKKVIPINNNLNVVGTIAPAAPEVPKGMVSKTFFGTQEQIDLLVKYAKEELWMEVK